MGAGRGRAAGRPVGISQQTVYCCDSDALINLQTAGLVRELRSLVQADKLKIPKGVYRELQRATDRLAKKLQV